MANDKLPNPDTEQAVTQIKEYLTRTLEVLDSGRVNEARGMLVKLYCGLDDYLGKEPKK